jgi:uncharacterized membrane protein YeaQ/YmgE (transglycosylase-associated protein family)
MTHSISIPLALLLLIGSITGQFIYQFFNNKNYKQSFERSFFQTALIITLILLALIGIK